MMNHGSNAQQIYALVALFTCLEALLGVINACLPVLKPIFKKFGDSHSSAWLSSVFSGTIPIFMRISQINSRWTSPSATKKDSGMEKEMPERPRLPESHGRAAMMSPPPAANLRSPSLSSPVPRGPPVPPKGDDYQPSPTKDWDRRKHGKGIQVQTEWDVERGISEESDRQPLDPRRDYKSRW